jgi:hypothetical protein
MAMALRQADRVQTNVSLGVEKVQKADRLSFQEAQKCHFW